MRVPHRWRQVGTGWQNQCTQTFFLSETNAGKGETYCRRTRPKAIVLLRILYTSRHRRVNAGQCSYQRRRQWKRRIRHGCIFFRKLTNYCSYCEIQERENTILRFQWHDWRKNMTKFWLFANKIPQNRRQRFVYCCFPICYIYHSSMFILSFILSLFYQIMAISS